MKLKHFRNLHNLSVADVADGVKVTRQHIYEIERGSAFAGRSLAYRIEIFTNGEVTRDEVQAPLNTADFCTVQNSQGAQ
jgi:predicted transcriptional regulator